MVDSSENSGEPKSALDVLQLRARATERFIQRLGAVEAGLLAEVTAAVASLIEHEP